MVNPQQLADLYQPDFGIEWIQPHSREVLAKIPHDQLVRYANARKYAEQRAEQNPVGAGWILPSWRSVMQAWKKYPIIVILGGQRSTKSSFASRLCVWAAATIRRRRCGRTT